jgi:hypothetical protein
MNSGYDLPRQASGPAAGIFTLLLALPGISHAQVKAGVPMTGPPVQTQSEQSRTDQPQPKNVLTIAEINALDAGFHKKMDAAQDAFAHEKFADAEDGFSQLAKEIQDTIKRISTATLQKNSFIEIDGVKKPATIQTETEWFTRSLNKAQQRKNAAGILLKVTDIQKQAADLLSAGKYPDDRDAYQKATDLLAESRAQVDDTEFQFYSARSENGLKVSLTTYWAKQFRSLRDKYNRTTDDPKMSPEEVHQTIKSVADEIVREGYVDPTKHPDMPADARLLFRNLLDAANQYLGSQ